jgi:hypothetical protein
MIRYRIFPFAPGLQNGSSWRHAFHKEPALRVKGAEYVSAGRWLARFLRVWFWLFSVTLCCACSVPAPHRPKPVRANLFAAKALPFVPRTNCIVLWNFPTNRETPDMVFKLRGTNNLLIPKAQWPVLTNVPGNLRSVRRSLNQPVQFFTLTASNSVGESAYATTQ